MILNLTPEDFAEVRSVTSGLISYIPTDEQILASVQNDVDLLGSAFMWGWGDSEVLVALCEDLEAFRAEGWASASG